MEHMPPMLRVAAPMDHTVLMGQTVDRMGHMAQMVAPTDLMGPGVVACSDACTVVCTPAAAGPTDPPVVTHTGHTARLVDRTDQVAAPTEPHNILPPLSYR